MDNMTNSKQAGNTNEVSRILVQMIDKPFEDFKKDVEKQELSLGLTNTARVYLEIQYNRVAQAKDDMLSAVENETLDLNNAEVTKNINDLYLTLQNIENKVEYLRKRAERLVKEVE